MAYLARTGYILMGTFLFFSCNWHSSTKIANGTMGVLPDKVDYNFHIKPLLSDRCFSCHGPDAAAREADLRLDVPKAVFSHTLDNGQSVLTPGKAERSEVWRRITSSDPEVQMPPPESNLSLSENEKALLKRWIDQGAEYSDHWAFIPPEKPAVPPMPPNWGINPIDAFIAASAREKTLKPAPEAEKSAVAPSDQF